MLKKHTGDCSIYASLCNNVPEAGICTCGYGHEYQWKNNGDISELYSKELIKKLEKENKPISRKYLREMFRNNLDDI